MLLAGHLSCLSATDLYRYLSQEHEATTIGVLLGMAAAKRCSADAAISKMLFLHVPTRHPPTYPELELSPHVQAAAILGAGLLYMGSCHRSAAPNPFPSHKGQRCLHGLGGQVAILSMASPVSCKMPAFASCASLSRKSSSHPGSWSALHGLLLQVCPSSLTPSRFAATSARHAMPHAKLLHDSIRPCGSVDMLCYHSSSWPQHHGARHVKAEAAL